MIQIIGKGGFAREVDWYTEDHPNVFFENEEITNCKTDKKTVIAIGDPKVRRAISAIFPELNYHTIIKAKCLGVVVVGVGSILCPGTILTTNIEIGKHVIINLNCTIGHDCKIGDFTTISPGANISGNVTIGSECYIGTNVVIRENVTICNNVTIGAGAVVIRDITEPGTYVGNPCKLIIKPNPLRAGTELKSQGI